MSSVFPTALNARTESLISSSSGGTTTTPILSEVQAIQSAVMASIAAGTLEATVTAATTMTNSTVYFNVWQNLSVDRAKAAQMQAVIQYFSDLGYTLVQKLNTGTNNTFFWDILF